MARTFEVLTESAYLPHSAGEEIGFDGEPTGRHVWEKVLYLQGQRVSEEDLAPDYVKLYDDEDKGILSVIRESGGEATPSELVGQSASGPQGGLSTQPSQAEAAQAARIAELEAQLEAAQAAASGNASDVEPGASAGASTDGEPKVTSDVKPDGAAGELESATPVQGYDNLNASDIISRADRWSLPRLEATLQHERAGENRSTVIAKLEKRVAEEQEKGGSA